jgi:hypothetical protein
MRAPRAHPTGLDSSQGSALKSGCLPNSTCNGDIVSFLVVLFLVLGSVEEEEKNVNKIRALA